MPASAPAWLYGAHRFRPWRPHCIVRGLDITQPHEAREPLRGVDLALALVNTVDLMNSPPDWLVSPEKLGWFLSRTGYPEAADAVTEDDLAAARDLRGRITAALDADEKDAAAILNALAAEGDMHPRIAESPGGRLIEYGPGPAEGPGFLAGATVVPLLQLLASGDWGRLGRCAAAPCCCVFIDRSPRRARKYCCKLCSDRVNQQIYRQRHAVQ